MKTKFKHIHFVKIADKPKTIVWSCQSNKPIDHLGEELGEPPDDELGIVEWHGPWRQYCFSPNLMFMSVFNASCLDDIAAFIRSLPRKSGPKPKGE